jgi:hypothetical protein
MIMLYALIIFEIALIIFLSQSFYSLFKNGVPFTPITKRNIARFFGLIKLENNKILCDLGCGDGRVLKMAEKKFKIKGIGYEVDWFAFLKAKLKTWPQRKNIKIIRRNFFTADLEAPDYIFLYLDSNIMAKLEPKILAEIKNPCQIISFAFQFPNLKPIKVFEVQPGKNTNRFFIYHLN